MNRASSSDAFSAASSRVAVVAAASRPSACPGLLRIVAARDGGLCRIKLPGGELTAAQALAIADASSRHAGGTIELTNRANVQIRGVRRGCEEALIGELMAAGLGPGGSAVLNASAAAADDLRNVMISPLAGRDPQALVDTRPLCRELLALLHSEPRFAALSPKFALLLDGGERLMRRDHPHDVWMSAMQTSDGVRFVVGLAGCPVDTDAASTSVASTQVPALVRALLLTFVDLAAPDATRMRHLLAAHSPDTVLHQAQMYLDFPLPRDMTLAASSQRGGMAREDNASLRFGAHRQNEPHRWHAGAQPPLGRAGAESFRRLAALAREHGNGTLHITPWQSVLLTDLDTRDVPHVLNAFDTLDFDHDPAQPFARLIACTGSSGCAKGLADTQADARALAARLPANAAVHLSGCARSCAAAQQTPFTLLAVAPGRYDLYRRDGGPGFGAPVAHHLTIDEAARLLDPLSRSAPDA